VPNATVMMIEHAERFGLAQLPPIARTRRAKRTPVLLSADGLGGVLSRSAKPQAAGEPASRPGATERARAINRRVCDREEDLRIRGPGEFFWIPAVGHAGVSALRTVRMPISSAGAAGGLCR